LAFAHAEDAGDLPGWTTLEYFIERGWVDTPRDLNDWQGDEILNAYVQVRMTIALSQRLDGVSSWHSNRQAYRHPNSLVKMMSPFTTDFI
jgi:hypothetical protein